MNKNLLTYFLSVCGTFCVGAAEFSIDFEQDDQGNDLFSSHDIAGDQPYTNIFATGVGVTFSTNDPANHPLTIYDTEATTGEDPDLERNSGEDGAPIGQWSMGNNINGVFGNALIINQNPPLVPANDSGQGGDMILDFDIALISFGFDFVDLDQAVNGDLVFYDSVTDTTVIIGFEQFETGGTYDVGALFGNHAANSIPEITVDQINTTESTSIESFDQVRFELTSSGAIGTVFGNTVPEPSSIVLTMLGGMTLLLRRKR